MRLIRTLYPTNPGFLPETFFARTPWAGFENEVDRLVHSTLSPRRAPVFDGSFPVDLYADKETIHVRAELPGMERDSIRVEVVDGCLNIQASRKSQDGDPTETVSVSRSIGLADDVQTEKVSAQFENGILTVTLPKMEAVQPKKVTVPVN